jgi:putative ATP-dependent endonuclease of OLD family
MVQKFPEAFLGSSIIVCEGDTEIGFCRALDARWSADELYNPFAVRGIVPIDGEGSRNSPRCPKCLAAIGYRVVYFGDSDCPLNPNAADMEQAGIKTILWSDGIAIEERVASDLPWAGLLEVLALAVEMHGENKIRAAVISKHGASPDLLAAPSHWTETTSLRTAIGAAAKAGDWFKTLDRGERLGNIVVRLLPDVPQSDLATKLSDLKQWVDSHG